MANKVYFRLEGEKKLIAKLGRVKAVQYLAPAMESAVQIYTGELKRYPAPAHKKFHFVSQKQRIFVIAAIHSGLIHVPYRRRKAGGLAGAWTSKVLKTKSQIVGLVSNATPYAPYVMSTDEQASYHKGVWPTVEDAFSKVQPQIENTFYRTIQHALNK